MREEDDTHMASQLEGHTKVAEVVEIHLLRDRRHESLLVDARELMMSGQDAEALDACRKALRLVPGCPQALMLTSTLTAIAGREKESLRFAMELVQSEPKEADGYYEVAISLLDMGYPEEALAWLEMGTDRLGDRDDDDLVDFFTAAQTEALAILSRYEEAEATLEAALRDRGDDLGLIAEAAEQLKWLRGRSDC